MRRVVHSLMGSQTNPLGDFVNSMACNPSGQPWSRVRRGQGGATRPRVQRGRQVRRAARVSAQRSGGDNTRNSVNLSFRGSEWETMRVWPQSIDFQAGFGDELLYDALEETGADGFRLRYSSGANTRMSGGTSAVTGLSDDDIDASAAERDEAVSSLLELECAGSGTYDLDDSYLSANRTMPAQDSEMSDGLGYEHTPSAFEGLGYAGSSLADDEEDWGLDCYDAHGVGHSDEIPLGRIAGKRKYSEMCNSPATPHRCAPVRRCRSMAPNGARAAQPSRLSMPRLAGSGGDAPAADNAERGGGAACGDANWEETDASYSLYSPNISISLGSQPGGASPDSAEAASPRPAAEHRAVRSDASGSQQQEATSRSVGAHFCHLELLPSGRQGDGDLVLGAVDAWPPGAAAGARQRSDALPTGETIANAGRDSSERVEQVESAAGSVREGEGATARGCCDPLASADVHALDSRMAALSLPPHTSASVGTVPPACAGGGSPRQAVDAAKSGSATYKTQPDPLGASLGVARPCADAPQEASEGHLSPARMRSESASGRALADAKDLPAAPVRKNQCCAVM